MSASARDSQGEALLAAVISQHLLASELASLEQQCARLQAPATHDTHAAKHPLEAARSSNISDCRHLEMSLQSLRCEHTAADTALESALSASEQVLRDASAALVVAQDQMTQLLEQQALATAPASPALPPLPPPRRATPATQQQPPPPPQPQSQLQLQHQPQPPQQAGLVRPTPTECGAAAAATIRAELRAAAASLGSSPSAPDSGSLMDLATERLLREATSPLARAKAKAGAAPAEPPRPAAGGGPADGAAPGPLDPVCSTGASISASVAATQKCAAALAEAIRETALPEFLELSPLPEPGAANPVGANPAFNAVGTAAELDAAIAAAAADVKIAQAEAAAATAAAAAGLNPAAAAAAAAAAITAAGGGGPCNGLGTHGAASAPSSLLNPGPSPAPWVSPMRRAAITTSARRAAEAAAVAAAARVDAAPPPVGPSPRAASYASYTGAAAAKARPSAWDPLRPDGPVGAAAGGGGGESARAAARAPRRADAAPPLVQPQWQSPGVAPGRCTATTVGSMARPIGARALAASRSVDSLPRRAAGGAAGGAAGDGQPAARPPSPAHGGPGGGFYAARHSSESGPRRAPSPGAEAAPGRGSGAVRLHHPSFAWEEDEAAHPTARPKAARRPDEEALLRHPPRHPPPPLPQGGPAPAPSDAHSAPAWEEDERPLSLFPPPPTFVFRPSASGHLQMELGPRVGEGVGEPLPGTLGIGLGEPRGRA